MTADGGDRPGAGQTLSAFTRHLGFTLIEAEPGRAVLHCPFRPEFTNMSGVAHGGVAAALMDTACGVALTAQADGRRAGKVVTVMFSLNFLAPFRDGMEALCEARVLGGGAKLASAEARMTDAATGALLATGHGSFRRIA
jgi:uncharacterized protein (TIGR00369 family)